MDKASFVFLVLFNFELSFFALFASFLAGLVLSKLVDKWADTRRNSLNNNELYSLVDIESLEIPAWQFDTSTLKILSVNAKACERYGFSKVEFLNKTILDLRPLSERIKLENHIKNPKSGIKRSGIWKHWDKQENEFWVSVVCLPILSGNRLITLALANPIENNNLSDELKKKVLVDFESLQKRHFELLSSLNNVVYSCQPEPFRVTFVNKASAKAYGYEPEEFILNPDLYLSIILDEDKNKVFEALLQLETAGHSETEFRVRHKNGEIKIFYDKAIGVFDDQGKLIAVNGVSTDVTELREAQAIATKSQQKLYELIQHSSDAFWSFDQTENIVYANEAYLILSPTKQHIPALVDEESLQIWKSHIKKVWDGEHISFRCTFGNETVGFQVLEIAFYPISDLYDQIIEIGCFARDITDIENNISLLQKQNDRLREIAWKQSHEVRAPLANIMGLIDLIQQGESNDEILPMILLSARKLDSVIHSIVLGPETSELTKIDKE